MARACWISRSFCEHLSRDILAADELRVQRGDLHRDVVHQFLEIVRARHEVGLAVDLHQNAQLGAGMDVAADHALPRRARGLLGRRGDAALAQNDLGFRQVAAGLRQGALAFHHARARALAELLSPTVR